MKKIIVLAIVTIFMACKPEVKGLENISVIELKNRIDNNKDLQVLDVRTPSEWKSGSIENSLKADVTAKDFEKKAVEKLDKNKEVYVYCRSGGRSLKASKILLEKGYKPINVEGGYKAWEAKVTPVK